MWKAFITEVALLQVATSAPHALTLRADAPNTELFTNFTSTLATEQQNYFINGGWPETNEWEAAFAGTVLSSSTRSLTSALKTYGSFPGSTDPGADQQTIESYYAQIQQYYDFENAPDIYDDAYDDVQWVVLGWLEAIRLINEYKAATGSDLGQDDIAKYAHRAHIFYNRVQDKFDTSLCDGGLTWNPNLLPYKNSITNELFISSSIGMYLYYPGDNDNGGISTGPSTIPTLAEHDPSLLENAKKEYDWFMSHGYFNDQGLIIDGFHISDGQTSCDQADPMVYTYNQGVLLSGMRQLWEATGNTTYLTDAYSLINTASLATGWNNASASDGSWAGLGRNGIMEDYCDADASCSQDAQIFKGIYFHHLRLFCEALPTQTATIPGITVVAPSGLASTHASNCQAYQLWVQHNADAALGTRNETNIVGGWWGENAAMMSTGSKVSVQSAHPYAVALPAGAVDYRNNPQVLKTSPWSNNHSSKLARRDDINDQGRGRTMETEVSGLSVVKTAWDLA